VRLDAVEEKRRNVPATDEAHRELARDHPTDEAQKSYHTILEQQIAQAKAELERPATGVLLSGLAAGLDIVFGPFVMAVALTTLRDVLPTPLLEFLAANLYCLGFIFVVLGRSSLFTEHTTSAVQPVLARRATLRQLMRLWGLVLLANLVGATLFALLAVRLGPALQVIDQPALSSLAIPLVDKPSGTIFLSGLVAGWLMGLLSWLVASSRETVSQILCVWLATMAIGLGKMHHSIAGSIEVLMGVFGGVGVTGGDYGRFLVWSVTGNAIGGAVFVALLKFSSVARSKG